MRELTHKEISLVAGAGASQELVKDVGFATGAANSSGFPLGSVGWMKVWSVAFEYAREN